MGGGFYPTGAWQDGWSAARNLIDNPVIVQFVHRWWAWIAAGAALLLARRARARMPSAPLVVGGLVVVQMLLGIGTLLSGVAIPIAVAHQAVGALLVAAMVTAAHAIGRPRRG
jgi:cytochrome c oxidase assembly protein subunit 15